MALPATADFTGTNGTAVRTLTNWDGANNLLTSGGAYEIQSNAAQAAAGGSLVTAADWWTGDTFDDDQYSQATVTARANGIYSGVAVRCSGVDNTRDLTGYFFYSAPDAGCYIDKYVDNEYIDTLAGPETAFAVNDVIRIEISGNAITCKVNGSTVLTATDSSSPIASGAAGICAYGAGSSSIDSWEGGNLNTGITGTASVTLGAVTSSAAGKIALAGSLSKTLGALTSSAAGTVAISGSATPTLGALTLSAAGEGEATSIEGALAVTLGALTSSAAGTVQIAGASAATLGALTSSATGTLAIAGASTPTLGALTTTARGYILTNACVGGVLTVNATNARYVENDAGIVYLAGFHTWYNIQDGGPFNPPDTFDWSEYLAALVSNGCTFTKLWASLETPRGWSHDNDQWVSLQRYERSSTGGANDGGNKFDLTKINREYLERLRARTIEAGNAGIYVAIQLFQGWQVENNKAGDGTPGLYHPYNVDNNINSLDPDDNSDDDLRESQYRTNNPALPYQEDLVEAIIDAVNDLDNVIFEICNEPTGSAENTDWQEYLIAHIQTYEAGKAKQHLVGMTVQWPNGDNAVLDSSGADWVSYNSGKANAIHAATDPVSMYDTDHTFGLTDTLSWALEAFCNGHGGSWFMDQWEGAIYGTDTRADATHNSIRRLTGDVADYADQIDLENAAPQSLLSSTGYCLAKTTGQHQFFVYQADTGAFDLTLTDYAGTFSLEWFRVSTGATQAGDDVSGGAVRTLTPPWTGAVTAFLELIATSGAVSITLGALTSSAAGVLVIAGEATPTLSAATLAAAGTLAIAGAATPTLDALTSTAAGVLAIAGAAASTLDAVTSSAAGALAIVGAATIELGAVTLTAAGVLIVPGTGGASITLDALTSSAAGVLAIAGAGAPTLDAVTSSAVGALAIAGTGVPTLADATITTAGVLAIAGTATATLDATTLAAAATLAMTGTATPTLDALTLSASSGLLIQGQASITLAAVTLTATDLVMLVYARRMPSSMRVGSRGVRE